MADINYGAINAKVKHMKGQLLTYDDFYLLCNFKKEKDMQIKLHEYPAYLKRNYSYDQNFEKDRKIDFYDDFCKIVQFINDYNIKKYLRTVFFEFQAEIIKKIVYFKINGQNFKLTERENDFLGENDPYLNIPAVLEAENLSELIKNFKGSIFYETLKETYGKNPEPYEFERGLERFCFKARESAKKMYLLKEDAQAVSVINGTCYDMQNIIRICKYKKYYDREPFAYSYLIPYQYRLKSNDIEMMLSSKNYNELIQIIKQSPYAEFINEDTAPEKSYFNALKSAYKRNLNKDNISFILYYLFLKEYEIKNLCMIHQGIKYGLSRNEIMELLYL